MDIWSLALGIPAWAVPCQNSDISENKTPYPVISYPNAQIYKKDILRIIEVKQVYICELISNQGLLM